MKFQETRPGVGVIFRCGGGKTRFSIDLAYNMRAKMVIVLCYKTVIPTWIQQIAEHWPAADDWRPVIADFDGTKTLEYKFGIAQMSQRNALADGRPFWLLINYESFWRSPARQWILSKSWDLAIADECQELSSPGSKQSRAAQLLARLAHKRLGLSGTPLRSGPMNAYGICRFLDGRIFGTSYTAFKKKYGIFVDVKAPPSARLDEIAQTMSPAAFKAKYQDPRSPQRVWRYQNIEDFNRRLGSVFFQYNGDPPCKELDIERLCTLGPEGRRVYTELFQQFCADVKGGSVTPANAAVRLLRLQQVTSGFVGDDAGRLVSIGDEKEKLLEEVLSELGNEEPVVVWCRFHHDLDVVHTVALRLGRASLELSGRRNDLAQWRAEGATAILSAQISTGVGINDLVLAKYSIDYSIGYSLLDYTQHRARFNREGQSSDTVYFIHLLTDTVADKAVYKALSAKRDVVEMFMEMAQRETGAEVQEWTA